jgi:hypothetical protein
MTAPIRDLQKMNVKRLVAAAVLAAAAFAAAALYREIATDVSVVARPTPVVRGARAEAGARPNAEPLVEPFVDRWTRRFSAARGR